MIKIVSTFKDRINEAFEETGIKAVDVADWIGVTEATMSQYRSGRATPRYDKLIGIANSLNVSPVWLMGANVSKGMEERK